MRSVHALHITLELVPGSEPIRGTVCGKTNSRSFIGWMQLITALRASIHEDETHLSELGPGADTNTCPHHTPQNRPGAKE